MGVTVKRPKFSVCCPLCLVWSPPLRSLMAQGTTPPMTTPPGRRLGLERRQNDAAPPER